MPLAPPLKEGLYLHCAECGAMTPVEDDTERTDAEWASRHAANRLGECAQCLDQEADDPWCTELVRVENCAVGDSCEADNHHHGHGQHFVELVQ